MDDRFKFRLIKDGNIVGYEYWSAKAKSWVYINLDGSKDFLLIEHDFKDQCTGLKDENGTLIYERDYVELMGAVIQVYWGVKFGIGWITKTVKASKWINKTETNSLTTCGVVIGNSYQIPELLTKNKLT